MINILHVADKLSVGNATLHGVTRLFSWWMPRFDKMRFNPIVCSLRQHDKAAEYLESLGTKVYCLGRGKFDFRTLFDLQKIIRSQNIHILHLHGYGATIFGRVVGRMTGVVTIIHEHIYDENIPFYQRWADRALSSKTSHAIAVSESVKDFMARFRAINPDRIRVIINGIPLQAGSKINSENEVSWKSKLNIPALNKVVVTVGRLDPIKGLSYFLEAAKRVLDQYKTVTFLVVGDGEQMSPLKQQCETLGISSDVIFMGYCQDVHSLLSEMDIKVIASLFEGGPLTLFEAMAAGCAVISTNTIGLRHVIQEGETGFLVLPKNPEAIAEKIICLLNDEKRLLQMSHYARVVSKKYDVFKTVQQFESYYEEILQS